MRTLWQWQKNILSNSGNAQNSPQACGTIGLALLKKQKSSL